MTARRGLAACATAAAVALLASACGSGTPAAAGNSPVSGGTVRWALAPTEAPNFIFPFTPGSAFTITNTDQFEYLMYRPLYWFGSGSQPTLNKDLSLAYPPVYQGQTVTIRLKPNYKWSNGEPVTAKDVVFWMNMMKKEELNWGGYVQNAFPDNVGSYKATGTYQVTMTIKGKYSPPWFTSNELSQVTPMPMAWDVTGAGQAPGSGHCSTGQAGCVAVYNYLMSQANDTKTYATSKIWSVVDGPWKLQKFSTDGNVTFVSNPQYSGKLPAHHISVFQEVPFTTEQAEYNDLQAGGSQRLDVGYLPTVDAPVPPAGQRCSAACNPLAGYKLAPLYSWGINYMPYDFHNPVSGPIFSQLYFREALQDLVDQEGVINGPLHGYGKASVGPVGDVPTTKYLSQKALEGDKFTLNPTAANRLLDAHGWTSGNGAVRTCVRPGPGPTQCGPGVHQGAKLNFTLAYVSGLSWVQSAIKELASNAAQVGIHIKYTAMSFDSVIGQVTKQGCYGATHDVPACTWDLADWGNGWSYSPDFLPTGENLFMTGSVDNFGAYSNARNDANTEATVSASNSTFYKAFYKWEDYLAGQIPVVMEPNAPYELVETANDLHTNVPASTLTLTPENWYFVK